MPGPTLESIAADSPTVSTGKKLLDKDYNVIYQATTQAYQKYQKALGKYEKHGERNPSIFRKYTTLLPHVSTHLGIVNFFVASQNFDTTSTFTLYFGCQRVLSHI